MKKLIFLTTLFASLFAANTYAQSPPPSVGYPIELVSPKGDTLLALLFSIKRGFAARMRDERRHLYIGWSAYRIEEKFVTYPESTRLYTLASSDAQINGYYDQYRANRKLYTFGLIGGGALIVAGGIVFAADLGRNLFSEDPDIMMSVGLTVSGLVLLTLGFVGLGVSLKNARQAVRLYHEQNIEKRKGLSLELGASAYTSAGLAVRLRF